MLLTTIALATCIYVLRIRVKKAVAVLDGIIIAGITNDSSRHISPWKPPRIGSTTKPTRNRRMVRAWMGHRQKQPEHSDLFYPFRGGARDEATPCGGRSRNACNASCQVVQTQQTPKSYTLSSSQQTRNKDDATIIVPTSSPAGDKDDAAIICESAEEQILTGEYEAEACSRGCRT
jgi:hypothetical protein